jgi:hypothetical protein
VGVSPRRVILLGEKGGEDKDDEEGGAADLAAPCGKNLNLFSQISLLDPPLYL